MPKPQPNYICQSCGSVYRKWQGKCDSCGEWNSIAEEQPSATFTKLSPRKKTGTIALESLTGETAPLSRISTTIIELDRVLGGGLVPGSAVLIGGDPGIGKSTLLLQAAAKVKSAIYITGEESVSQVRLRAERLGFGSAPMQLAAATSVAEILASLDQKPETRNLKPEKESIQASGFRLPTSVIIIDSIQTMYVDEVESAPGTVTQLRTSAHELIRYAKTSGAVMLLVGHVTKDGQIAGPKVLEHMVDTVLYFEGERGHPFRILRAVKNRFGPANEIGVFEMTEEGLKEVPNPSALFLSGRNANVSGSSVFAGMEGTRPVLVEIQSLVAPSPMATPRRAAVGWDLNRLAMMLAVLQARANVQVGDKEIYVNVAGGIRLTEPAADLAVIAALISAISNIPLPADTIFFGEVGLSGEVRQVGHAESRLREAEKLGFTHAFVPNGMKAKSGLTLYPLSHITELKTALLSGR